MNKGGEGERKEKVQRRVVENEDKIRTMKVSSFFCTIIDNTSSVWVSRQGRNVL